MRCSPVIGSSLVAEVFVRQKNISPRIRFDYRPRFKSHHRLSFTGQHIQAAWLQIAGQSAYLRISWTLTPGQTLTLPKSMLNT